MKRDTKPFHPDAEEAFKQSKIDTAIQLKRPDGCDTCLSERRLVLLTKSLYGFKQAAQAWFSMLITAPEENGLGNVGPIPVLPVE